MSRSNPFPRGNSNAYVMNIADHSWSGLKELAFFLRGRGQDAINFLQLSKEGS